MPDARLAFTPDSDFEYESGHGNVPTDLWGAIGFPLPRDKVKRTLYPLLSWHSPNINLWVVVAHLEFLLEGKVKTSIPYWRYGPNAAPTPGRPLIYPPDGEGVADGMTVWEGVSGTPTQFLLMPFVLTVAADEFRVRYETRIDDDGPPPGVGGTGEPVWFMGVKSEHLW